MELDEDGFDGFGEAVPALQLGADGVEASLLPGAGPPASLVGDDREMNLGALGAAAYERPLVRFELAVAEPPRRACAPTTPRRRPPR